MSFQLPVTLDRASRKKDRSLTITFTTNTEISTEDYAEIDRQMMSEGWLLFKANEFQDGDLPDEPAQGREGKSKGQRLRAVHYLVWQRLGTDEPFETWYTRRFEAMMQQLKDKLD